MPYKCDWYRFSSVTFSIFVFCCLFTPLEASNLKDFKVHKNIVDTPVVIQIILLELLLKNFFISY